jgi:hypothetical protein
MTDITDNYLSLAIDSEGDSYVAYWTNGTNTGQTFIDGTYMVVVTKISTFNQVKWTQQLQSYNVTGYGWQPNVAVDSLKNVYVTFPTPGTMTGETSTGGMDTVVWKMNTNGVTQWVRQQPTFNTTGDDTYPAIVTDYTNSVYVAYRTTGVVPGGISSGGTDIVVYKLDTDGVFQWVKQDPLFNTSADDTQPTITIDKYGAVYVAYWTEGGTVLGQVNTGNHDVVVFKLDTHGVFQWARQSPSFNTTGFNELPVVAVDGNQNTYVAYITDGVASGQTNAGDSDIVVFKLDVYGNTLWIQQQPTFNTDRYDDYPAITVDVNGNAFVAYTTTGVASGQTFTGWTYDVVIFKLSTNGYTQWVQQQPSFNTGGENINPAIGIDTQGSLYIAYPTDGTISGVSVSGPYDIVVFKLLTSVEVRPIITCDDANLYYLYYTNEGKAEDQFDMVFTKKTLAGVTLWEKRDPSFNQISSKNPTIVAYKQGLVSFFYVVFQTAGELVPGESLFPFDIVVMKLDTNGNILWVQQNRTFNTTRSDEFPSADVDNNGNLYVAYQTLGRAPGGYRLAFKDKYDIVVFKMSPSGTTLWIRQSRYVNSERGGRNPYIRVDRVNNTVYVVYSSDGRVYQQPISGDSDIVIFKLNATSGAIMQRSNGSLWILQNPSFNTETYDENPNIYVDNLGYVYLCYSTSPGGYATGLSNWGGYDLILCKFDPDGNVVKIIQSPVFDTPDDETHPSMTYRSGYLYIAYQTTGAVSGQSHTGHSDIVVMKVNTVTMDVVWIRQNSKFNTTADDTSPSITTDALGNCYFAYETAGNFYQQPFGSAYQAVVVAKLNSAGSFVWVKR